MSRHTSSQLCVIVNTLLFSALLLLAKVDDAEGYVRHVSFYGDSYIHVPIRSDMAKAAEEDLDLELHFRTSRDNALLLLAVGPGTYGDFCMVTLDNGAVVVRADLGSGELTLTATQRRAGGDNSRSGSSSSFADQQWHYVNVTWSTHGVAILSVDRVYNDSTPIPGKLSKLTVVNGYTFVGGTGSGIMTRHGTRSDVITYMYAGRDVPPFRGCMYHATFNGYDVFELAQRHSARPETGAVTSSVSYAGVTWSTCVPELTATSNQIISFVSGGINSSSSSSSYALFDAPSSLVTSQSAASLLSVSNRTSMMSFDLRTRSSAAIVLYGGHGLVSTSHHSSSFSAAVAAPSETSTSSFLVLEIVDARLVLRIVGERGRVLLTSSVAVDDGSWHHVDVSVDVQANTISMSVDGRQVDESADPLGGRPIWYRSANIFVGGVSAASKPGLLRRQLEYLVGPMQTSALSLSGCIRRLTIGGSNLGFQEMVASRGLQVGCIWTYPCQSNPCPPETECIEIGFDRFRCACRSANCMRSDDGVAVASIQGPLRLRDLVVDEGGWRKLSTDNVNLLVDYDVDDTAVLFTIVTPASYGVLHVTNSEQFDVRTAFTMADIRQGHVTYVSDGSENTSDRIVLQLSFNVVSNGSRFGSSRSIPDDLMQSHNVTLPVQITAVNDRPALSLPANDTVYVVANTHLPISSQIISVTDPDDPPAQLEITAIPINNGGDPNKYGYFELISHVGKHQRRLRVGQFSFADVVDNKIQFVHRGSANGTQYFRLVASDGKDISPSRVLQIVSGSMELIPINNTGLLVTSLSSQPLTSSNLAFAVGTAAGALLIPDVEIKYEITEPPKFGEIQRQQLTAAVSSSSQSDDEGGSPLTRIWKPVSVFTQRQIDRGRIRYVHLGNQHNKMPMGARQSQHQTDYFRLQTSAAPVRTTRPDVEFRINVVDCRVDIERITGLHIGGEVNARMGSITANELRAVGPEGATPDDVIYQVISTPRYGELLLTKSTRNNSNSGQRLGQTIQLELGSNFTQADVNQNRLTFRFHRVLFRPIEDDFEFQLSTAISYGGIRQLCSWTSDVQLFHVFYDPPPPTRLQFINNGLRNVPEGDTVVISSHDLFVEDTTNPSEVFQLTVTSGPSHGQLQFFDSETRLIIGTNVTSFDTRDIRSGLLVYTHDDTESEADSFDVAVITTTTMTARGGARGNDDGALTEQLQATFEINIILHNDNPPRKLADRMIELVAGGGRILGSRDLQYSDPDVNSDSASLEYTLSTADGPTAVRLVQTSNHSIVVDKFWQTSLADGSLFLEHTGSGNHSAAAVPETDIELPFVVSDGLFNVSDVIRIVVREPYIRVNSIRPQVEVEWNSSAVLTAENLGVESNLDLSEDVGSSSQLRYIVVEFPTAGRLRLKDSDARLRQFTHSQLLNGAVVYVQTPSVVDSTDSFRFVARLKSMQSAGEVFIRIRQPQHPDDVTSATTTSRPTTTVRPLNVVVQKLIVNESQPAVLTKEVLDISSPGVLPNETIYTVVSGPRFGSLSMPSAGKSSIRKFTQADINAARVQYQLRDVINQSAFAESNETTGDSIKFDVKISGEMTPLNSAVVLPVSIIPTVIPLGANDVVVNESDSAMIDGRILFIDSRQFTSSDLTETVTFTIVKPPTVGRIQTKPSSPGDSSGSGSSGAVRVNSTRSRITIFSWDQLQSGQIVYTHAGSEIREDRFTLVARVGARRSSPTTVRVRVNNVNNQPPVVVVNARMNVWTGSETVITRDLLLVEDNDTDAEQLTYTLLSRPTNGELYVTYPARRPVDSFTQADIDNQSIAFRHSGSPRSTFQFEVTDGVTTTGSQSFTIEATTLRLGQVNHRTLDAFPGLIQPITDYHLRYSTNDANQSRPITFVVRKKPRLGRIVVATSTDLDSVSTFTQSDIDNRLVGYEHVTASEETAWTQEDMFLFDVATEYARPLVSRMFTIKISYENVNADNVKSLMIAGPLTVDEGGTAVINQSVFDMSPLISHLAAAKTNVVARCHIVETPQHGALMIGGQIATSGSSFVQRDVDDKRVVYRHDDSETLSDRFNFFVTVSHPENGDGNEDDETSSTTSPRDVCFFNISVVRVNDKPFQLKTISPGIDVVQGAHVNITKEELFTIDEDNSPGEIVYVVTDLPTNGQLVYADDPAAVVSNFTQLDIDSFKISFIHDGSLDSAAFRFQVSDGSHKPLYKVFNIRVQPVHLRLGNVSDIELLQGENIVILTSQNFPLETNNKDLSSIVYNITSPPEFGELTLNLEPVDRFTQLDLETGLVAYHMSQPTAGFDSFGLTISDLFENAVTDVSISMIVKPRLRQSDKPLQSLGSEPITFTLNELDASELKLLSGIDPVYFVIEPPVLGVLVRNASGDASEVKSLEELAVGTEENRRKRSKRQEPESNSLPTDDLEPPGSGDPGFRFTHDDVVNGRIQYVPTPVPAGSDRSPQPDSFDFILTAPVGDIQPANGKLDLQVVPPELPPIPAVVIVPDYDPNDYDPPVDPEEEEGLASEHVTTALIVAGGTLTSICSIVSYRCYRLSRRRRRRMLQRQMEALKDPNKGLVDEGPESVERHATDLHPSEPLLIDTQLSPYVWGSPPPRTIDRAEARRQWAEVWLAEHGIIGSTQKPDDDDYNDGERGYDRSLSQHPPPQSGSRLDNFYNQQNATQPGNSDSNQQQLQQQQQQQQQQANANSFVNSTFNRTGEDGDTSTSGPGVQNATSTNDRVDHGQNPSISPPPQDTAAAGNDEIELMEQTLPDRGNVSASDPFEQSTAQSQSSTLSRRSGATSAGYGMNEGVIDRKPPLPPGRLNDSRDWSASQSKMASQAAPNSRAGMLNTSTAACQYQNGDVGTPPAQYGSVAAGNSGMHTATTPMLQDRRDINSTASVYRQDPYMTASRPSTGIDSRQMAPCDSYHDTDVILDDGHGSDRRYGDNSHKTGTGSARVTRFADQRDDDNTYMKHTDPNEHNSEAYTKSILRQQRFSEPTSSSPPPLLPPGECYTDQSNMHPSAVVEQYTLYRRQNNTTTMTSHSELDDVDADGGYATGSQRGGARSSSFEETNSLSAEHLDGGRAASVSTIGSPHREQILYDWDQVDPELIDLCRKTTPVLHKNQYWV